MISATSNTPPHRAGESRPTGWRQFGYGRAPRKQRRSPRPVLLSLVILFLLLTGACGADDNSTSPETASSSAAAAQVAVAEEPTAEEFAEMGEDAEIALADVQAALTASDDVASEDAQPESASAAALVDEGEDGAMAAAAESAMEEDLADEPTEGDNRDGPAADALVEVSAITLPSAFGRDIIYQGWVSVEAPDVAAATQRAIAVVQGLGGFVFGQQTRTRPAPYSEIVFKVLPEDFSPALARLSEIGELLDQQISADDVTERIVDLQSRIITSEASVSRLRSFLDTALDLEDLAFYERELLIRETDLERLHGQLRTLEDRVALATITLAISQAPERPVILPNTGLLVTAWASTDGEDPCLGDRSLTTQRDDTVDFCVEVANQGEVTLTDVRLSSDVLASDDHPFVIERGSFERIEPGQFLTATLTEEMTKGRLAGRIATRGLEILIEATATPMDPDTPQLGVISDRTRVVVTTEEVIPNPGVLVHAWVSGKDDDPCLGDRDITVRPDNDRVMFCIFVGNPGDVPLTNVEIRSAALDFEANPLKLEHGDFNEIEPRQFLTATLAEPLAKGRLNGRVATRGLDIEIQAIATPVDRDGAELDSISDTTSVQVTTQEILPAMLVSAWVSTGDDDPCLGDRDITLEPDADHVNICLEIGNPGEITLTDIVIGSTSLPLDDHSFIAEHGDFNLLEPGQFVTATLTQPIEDGRLAGRIATRGTSIEIEAVATPVEGDGTRLGDISETTNVMVRVRTSPSGDGPSGFGDALDASYQALLVVLAGAAVVIGALIPFLPLIIVLALLVRWIRRRRSSSPAATGAPEVPKRPTAE